MSKFVIANNQALPQTADVPDWVPVLPPGQTIRGKDGREFKVDDLSRVVSNTLVHGAVPVDENHSTSTEAPKGRPSPAVGWVESWDIRPTGLWAKIKWSARGIEALASRAYRFISPALRLGANGLIESIHSISLVNHPNLGLPALNSQQDDTPDNIDAVNAENDRAYAEHLRKCEEYNRQHSHGLTDIEREVCRKLQIPEADYAATDPSMVPKG